MAPPSQATTVFVRFIPPSVNIRRHHLEDVFSQIGPIKKSSVILPSSAGGAHKKKPHGKKDSMDNSTGNDAESTTAIAASSYGFVKYTTELDAQRAAEKLNHSNLKISATETVKLKVERASRVATATTTTSTTKRTTVASQKDIDTGASGEGRRRERSRDDDDGNESNKKKQKPQLVDGNPTKSSKREQQPQSLQQQDEQKRNSNQKKDENVNHNDDGDDDDEKNLKKTNRLIVRNLSFYAKKNHIRTALESQFGPILDIHIPTVNSSSSNPSSLATSNDTTTKATPVATHRGFCFVTFVHEKDAQNCLAAAEAAAAAVSSSSSSTTSDNNNTAPPSPILIAKRPVSISRALNKTAFEHQKQQQKQPSSTMSKAKVKNQQPLFKQDGGVELNATTANAVLEKNAQDDNVDSDGSSDSGSSNDDDDSAKNSSASDDESSSDDDEDDDDKNNDDASQSSKDNHQTNSSKVNTAKDENAVGEKRTLFLRNLPFDATRHDLFQLFYKFGFISGIYLVKDKETGIPKGTAFVSFRDAQSIERALQAAASAAASSSTTMTEHGPGQQQAGFSSSIGAVGGGGGLLLNGRRIFVDLAVDKDTAVTLTMDQKNAQSTDANKSDGAGTTKDRRNLYLKGEGRVDNHTDDSGHETNAWDELPESDQLKRQKAWSEKNSKLRSPLFFINPTRLSIRNLAKDVNEVALKRLCVEALQRGLENKLVAAQDQITHWKASGELSTRDILKRIESLPDEEDVIPKFEEENVRKYITSVFIDCEFGKNKKEKISRGFGFVEFEHHAHALACLRELNNNTRYTQEYAIGGKHAAMTHTRQRKSSLSSKKQKRQHKNDGDDQQVKLPRLIVEFAVENVAKAKQQAEHRALQQANMMKQKRESREKSAESKTKEKKKSRGQRQREKKRQRQEDGDDNADDAVNADGDVANEKDAATTRKKQQQDRNDKVNNSKIKKVKPPKRQKVDQEEAEFSKLVASYKSSFTADTSTDVADDGENQATAKKRWFE